MENSATKSAKIRPVGDRGRDNHLLVAPRTDPDGRSLAHPVLISDDWRPSEQLVRILARGLVFSGYPRGHRDFTEAKCHRHWCAYGP
jgi:hypothetical protein